MSNTPELLRQIVGAVDEKLHIVPYRWNPSTLAYEVETVTSGGTGSDVNVTNPVLAVVAVSLPLPTGASTAAKQDTGNASLASIDGKLPAALGGAGGLKVEVVASSGGGLTDTELRATPVPVSGPLTDAQLRTAAVPVSGPLTDTQLRAAAVPVSAVGLPLPAGASTEATLAFIKAKTDNLDVALSTRTKPADVQKVDGSAVTQPVSGTVALDAPSLAALETIQVGSSALPANASQETGGNLAAAKVDLDTIAAKDFATSAKQDTALATLTTIDTDLKAELGTLERTPAAYTVLDRLYQLGLKLDKQQGTLQGVLAALAKPAVLPNRTTLLHR